MFTKRNLIAFLLQPLKIILKRNPVTINYPPHIKSAVIFWPKSSFGILIYLRVLIKTLRDNNDNIQITLVINNSIIKKVDIKILKKLIGFNENDKIVSHNYLAVLRNNYNLSIIPSFQGFSLKTFLLAGFTKSRIRVGVSKINEINNPFKFIHDFSTEINWTHNPDMHLTETLLKLLGPLKYKSIDNITNLLRVNSTTFGIQSDLNVNEMTKGKKIVFINNQPEEVKNRWGIENLVRLLGKLVESGNYFFYYSEYEMEQEIKDILENEIKVLQFVNKNDIKRVINIISVSDLIITCNSDIMQIAGLFNVPQISIFGTDNPFIISPLGPNKNFLRSPSGLIDEVTGEEVFQTAKTLLGVE